MLNIPPSAMSSSVPHISWLTVLSPVQSCVVLSYGFHRFDSIFMISKKYQATRIAISMVSIFIFSDEFVIGVGQQTKLQELLC